ncbi:C4-dicarboxylate ABC transporter [Rhodobacteraceae bacterium RKSG542]|uniref:C4-dicarboxylate TRAP transporter substrate-binding protein n=1 Tax=Pseudovibrio flavus TaxID=2529854 RepID=UPI0012BCFCC7|nr:C4-dicarboxylate TRAP transporter substrate-binding protein [Pseudovibrio flavus]MTI17933.1 C4-dicarboxylate ABC transporter [Pseudovibrio flavus]
MLKALKKTLIAATVVTLGTFSAHAAPLEIKVAYENNPGEPLDIVMNYWADLIDEKSEGEIQFKLYPSSQLGSKKDITEQAFMGVPVITISDVGFLADYEPDLGILFGPYLSENPQALFQVYESDWFKEKEEALKEKGIHVVMKNYLYGTRQILSKKPIETLADMKGQKIRVPNNVMQIRAIESMGATATPMPLGEVYTALTQGIIDGVENPLPVLYGGRFHEEAKYLSMVDYLVNTSIFIGGEAFFSTLSEEQLDLVHSTAREAGLYSQELAAKDDAAIIAKMEAEGVTVIRPDVSTFREAAMTTYDQFPEWSEGLYEEIQAALK